MLAGAVAGEEPRRGAVGGRVHFRPVGEVLLKDVVKGMGDRDRLVIEDDDGFAFVGAADLLASHAGNACQRLGVEEQQRGGGAVVERNVVVLEGFAEQPEPFFLVQDGPGFSFSVGEFDAGKMLVLDGPAHEGPGRAPRCRSCREPVVDVRLPALGGQFPSC